MTESVLAGSFVNAVEDDFWTSVCRAIDRAKRNDDTLSIAIAFTLLASIGKAPCRSIPPIKASIKLIRPGTNLTLLIPTYKPKNYQNNVLQQTVPFCSI